MLARSQPAAEAAAPPAVLSGQFVDSAVIYLSYSTSSGFSGSTDANGNYSNRAGDSIKFCIDKIALGEGLAGATLTPIDLVSGATALDSSDIVKILQVLQTLDDDLDPINGIKIPAAVVARLAALHCQKIIKNLTDLTAGVITPSFASGATATGGATGSYCGDGVKAHYLAQGDMAEIDAAGKLTDTLSQAKPLLPLIATAAAVIKTKVQDYGAANLLAFARGTGVAGASKGYGTIEENADGNQSSPVYRVALRRSIATAFRGFVEGRVSDANVHLNFAPCVSACVSP